MKSIKKPEDMPKPIKWNKLSLERKESLKEVWWAKNANDNILLPKEMERANTMFKLRDKILAFGGEEVCMPLCVDRDVLRMFERGEFFYGSKYMKKGQPSHCHMNASLLWDANRSNTRIATGYALSEDGFWREHSWVVQRIKTKWRVWETTVPRVAYWGYIMTPEECEEFYWDNI